ncbi:hypothetical protein MPL1032_270112 [Mesorhizobium plurifarium]|uniref:Uncharacterized protein n=1 Tax=Mesorhizobium plurifarium TaxID=69974 RepID=A0A0K2W227_MESPL|nr:hypothetical protein MPL1032_270112 [Mesorhizobium plurifarium]
MPSAPPYQCSHYNSTRQYSGEESDPKHPITPVMQRLPMTKYFVDGNDAPRAGFVSTT